MIADTKVSTLSYHEVAEEHQGQARGISNIAAPLPSVLVCTQEPSKSLVLSAGSALIVFNAKGGAGDVLGRSLQAAVLLWLLGALAGSISLYASWPSGPMGQLS